MSQELRHLLEQKRKAAGWSRRELARRMDLSQAVVQKTLVGDRPPTITFCNKAAEVFGDSPELYLRLGGILPSTDEDDPTLQEIMEATRLLSPEQKQDVLKYIKFLRLK